MTLSWLPLGADQAHTLRVGNKAANLDRAAARGLLVPDGVIVLDAAWRRLLERELLTADGESVHRGDVGPFLAELALPDFARAEQLLAVRSAFSSEDGVVSARAGQFTSVLRVARGDGVALTRALASVWASSMVDEPPARRDVLVMHMVDARTAGVAFSEPDFADDLVEFVAGTAEGLVAGQQRGDRLELPRLLRRERPSAGVLAWQRRLQALLRDVRGVFGDCAWDVEWADDGAVCWLVQVRPVTRPTLRDEWFTAANHKEILPPLPSALMASVIAERASALFGLYRQLDPGLPASRPFLELFAGRPRINLSLLREMLRRWGLPTKLLADSVGGADPLPAFGWRPLRLLRRLPVLARLGWLQLGAVRRARRASVAMRALASAPRPDIATCLRQLGDAYVTLVHAMMALTGAMAGPLALLRRAGTLLEHAARHQTITAAMFARQDELRALAAARGCAAALAHGALPDDPQFGAAWRRYVDEFGHRGTYESDVGVPRTAEAPVPLWRALAVPAGHRLTPPPRSLRGWLTTPAWWLARRPLAAREALRHEAMRGFGGVRACLLQLAEAWAAEGRLPGASALFDLSQSELLRMADGWTPPAEFWTARHLERQRLGAIELTDVFCRSRALVPAAHADATRELRGLPLTRGVVEGVVWSARDPNATRPNSDGPLVLVAPAIDAGWIGALSTVAAVVVETGGELSHGSILVREVGLPAITNVSGALALLPDGARVQLDASAGLVRLI